MGLDQSAYKIKAEVIPLFEKEENGFEGFTHEERMKLESGFEIIAQWRKHANLQEWFTGLYGDDINCKKVWVDEVTLRNLEEDVLNDNLPHGEGFFWGQSSADDKEKDLAFIKEARQALKDGYCVFYTSWY